jgi:hypothetical protein
VGIRSEWGSHAPLWSIPDDSATHSSTQMLYIDGEGLLKRHDYDLEIAGGTPGAHYIEGYEEVSGIMFPTKRRIFPRRADGTASPEHLVVSIDLSDIDLN